MESLMKLESVSRNFGAIRALQNIDFEIKPGEIVGLVGDNGAGKTGGGRLSFLCHYPHRITGAYSSR